MSRAIVVRYRVKPEALDENLRLVKAVYDNLAEADPGGLRYRTYRVDERTFVHVALIEGTRNPLEDMPAFHAFAAGVAGRCEELPQALEGELVGSYPSL